jgi:hypothetical protein
MKDLDSAYAGMSGVRRAGVALAAATMKPSKNAASSA